MPHLPTKLSNAFRALVRALPPVVALASFFAAVPSPAGETRFHVSTSGLDGGPGTAERPFATPARARDAIREARSRGDPGPFVVELAGGLHELSAPLVLSAEDSGTAEAPVTWRSQPGGRAVLSGGRVLSGFVETREGGLRRWILELPEVRTGAWNFRQLFVSSAGRPFERRHRPQVGMYRVAGLTYSPKRVTTLAHRAAQADFVFSPGDIRPWRNLSEVEVVILHLWASSRMRIQKIDTASGVVTLTGMPTFAVNHGGLNPYYVENVAEELRRPGQWYLDRPAGLLTYLPLDGEMLADTRVVAPWLPRVLELSAPYALGRAVSHVAFEGLGFAFSESPLPAEGYGGSQGHPDLPAAIELTGATHCSFHRCTVSQTDAYGLAVGLGSQNNRVTGCSFFDLGGGGVKVGDPTMASKAAEPALPVGNRIENCAIHDVGVLHFSSNAVWCGIVAQTAIRHNRIWNVPYSGIAVGWSWTDAVTSCAGNTIEGNHLSNVMDLLADGASIYTLGRQPGTVIRGNIARDNPKSPFSNYHWQLGLYLDEGSSGILVESNLVHGVGTRGFNMNGGSENVIRNNILGPIHGKDGTGDGYLNCADKEWGPKGNSFTRNLLYFDSTNLVNAAWPAGLMRCSSNLYWNFAGRPFFFAGKSFAAWQATGQDAGSLAADPLFVDPGAGDYRLKDGSPAAAIGFVPWAAGEAGLEAAYRDVGAGDNVVRPPVYAMPLPATPLFSGFVFDCEEIPPGMLPNGFSLNGGGAGADIAVREGAGKDGGRGLAAVDSARAAKPFYPYLFYQVPTVVDAGTVEFSCDVRQKTGAPSALGFDFRDYSKTVNKTSEYVGSPGLTLGADGALRFGTQTLARTAPGTWTHLEFSLSLDGAQRALSLKIALADGSVRQAALPLAADFAVFTTLGIYCGESVDGEAYLDNLVLRVPGAAPGDGAAAATPLTNLSVLAPVAENRPGTIGFTLAGAAGNTVLVRAVGPGLTAFGVADALPDPRLEIHDADGLRIAENDDFSPLSAVYFARAGAFELQAGGRDAALVLRLPAGRYTATVTGRLSEVGRALLEVYALP